MTSAAWLCAQYIAGWELHEAWIAGIALSTTSVAVVYAVMIETGLNRTELGKMILAACFVNDFGTVLALGALFVDLYGYLILFVALLAVSRTTCLAGRSSSCAQRGARPAEDTVRSSRLIPSTCI
jgi:Kef-type K+ transport system membrane component KefB